MLLDVLGAVRIFGADCLLQRAPASCIAGLKEACALAACSES